MGRSCHPVELGHLAESAGLRALPDAEKSADRPASAGRVRLPTEAPSLGIARFREREHGD